MISNKPGAVSKQVVHHVGIKLSPGTYHVIPKVEDGYHIHLPCTFARNTPFEVDFSGVFFYFTVSSPLLHTSHLLNCYSDSTLPCAAHHEHTHLPALAMTAHVLMKTLCGQFTAGCFP